MSSSALEPKAHWDVALFGVEPTVAPLPQRKPAVEWVLRDVSASTREPQSPVTWQPSVLRVAANGFGMCVLWFAVVLLLLTVTPMLAGRPLTVVASGSMEPALRRGDVVVLGATAGDLPPGAVVAFNAAGGQVIHRIDSVTADGAYLTRGDANTFVDSTAVDRSDIAGVGTMVVPFIGLPNLWFNERRWGSLAAMAVAVGGAARISTKSWLYRRPRAESRR